MSDACPSLDPQCRETIHEIARAVAQETVKEFMLTLGVNTQEPRDVVSIQKDFAALRGWRESTEAVKRKGLLTAVSIIITGLLGAIAYAFHRQ